MLGDLSETGGRLAAFVEDLLEIGIGNPQLRGEVGGLDAAVSEFRPDLGRRQNLFA